MSFLILKQNVTVESVTSASSLSDIVTLLKKVTAKGFASLLPSFIFSIGHLQGVDPGAVNTSKDQSNEFFFEVDANESAIVSIFKKFYVSKTPFILQSAESLLNVIRAAMSVFGVTKTAVLVNVHHDMSLIDEHPANEKHKFLFYYGSQRGLRVAEYLKRNILKSIPDATVVILHHTASPRGRLGFIVRTLNTAIIAECGFISQKKHILQTNHETLADALLALNTEIQSGNI